MFGQSSSDAVKTFRVGCQDRCFVGLINVVALEQFVNLMAAVLGVETFVWKVGREKKWFVAGFLDREAQAAIITVEPDEDTSGFDVAAKVFARHHVGLRTR